ncbi:hypothetical protein FRC11_009277, partial [Ceratobasidium sp. 423]
MSHTLPAHPRWGQPIELFLSSFNETPSGPESDEGCQLSDVLEAIATIRGLSTETEMARLSELTRTITLRTLHALMRFAMFTPVENLSYFRCPSLLTGCVKLPAACVTLAKMPSVNRDAALDTVISRGSLGEPKSEEIPYRLLLFVSPVLRNCVMNTDSYNRCDWILGWLQLESPEYPRVNPLLDHVHAAILLDLISRDRKSFLKVFMVLNPIGMDAVLLLLWRPVVYQSDSTKDVAEAIKTLESFLDIICRYHLVAPWSHVYLIGAAVPDTKERMIRKGTMPTFHGYYDLDDSQTTISAFIRRFAPTAPYDQTR